MSDGYMGQVLYVDLTAKTCTPKPLDDEVRLYIGGKGYGARLLYDLTEKGVDPLGPANPLIFGTGPYNGTFGVQSTRFTVTAKSPLTGAIGNVTAGGDFANAMKRAGFDFIVVTGQAEKPVYVEVTDGSAEIKEAGKLWGMGTQEVQRQFPKAFKCAVIGPAGENLVRYASIIGGDRAAGRCGLGAVMGSKKLKAVICSGKKKVPIAKPDKFKDYTRWLTKYFKAHNMTGEILPAFGTANLLMTTSGRNILPTLNFQKGRHQLAWQISGEQMRKDWLVKNGGCTACPIHCGRTVRRPEGSKYGEAGGKIRGPEYETLGLMGSNIGVFDLAAVLRFNEAVDELGLDSISAGGTLAWAMEANEKGVWKNGLSFGDIAAVDQLIEDIAYRRGIGDELAEGSYRLAQKYGGMDFAMQVKGMELPAYDPRGCYGQGLEYATTNRGGCHINGATMFFETTGAISVDPLSIKAKPELVVFQQNLMAALNAMIICVFSSYAVLPSFVGNMDPQGSLYRSVAWTMKNSGPILRLVLKTKLMAPILWYEKYLGYVTGESYTLGRITESGERDFNMERLFNMREGFALEDDTLPSRLLNEPTFPGQEKGVPLDEMLPSYYKIRGWNPDGTISDKTLNRLQIRS